MVSKYFCVPISPALERLSSDGSLHKQNCPVHFVDVFSSWPETGFPLIFSYTPVLFALSQLLPIYLGSRSISSSDALKGVFQMQFLFIYYAFALNKFTIQY